MFHTALLDSYIAITYGGSRQLGAGGYICRTYIAAHARTHAHPLQLRGWGGDGGGLLVKLAYGGGRV